MATGAQNAFARHVFSVQRYVALTAARYASLHQPGLVTHPIICFGDPTNARIITVGLNPSFGEFTEKRGWPTSLDHEKLSERCRGYFSGANQPHNWFDPWITGLRHAGLEYTSGAAVHIDLSPRATRFVSDFKLSEQTLFREMVERDLWTFFGTLELCRAAEWLFIAGTVTGKFYINEFLQRYAPDHGYKLDGSFIRSQHAGRGKTAIHVLTGGGRKLNVFFCSSSPSDRLPTLLPQRIMEHVHHWKQ